MVDKLISFKEFCEMCEAIQECTKFGDKENVIKKFIGNYKNKKTSLNVPNITFYPFLRLLIPEYERERPPYGLKETSFSKLFVKTLCLQGSDANTLRNYNKMSTNAKNKDFADTAYRILRKWCPKTSTVTVADINYHLDQMAKKHMDHQPREVEKELSKLIKSSTAIEQKWMIRLILKSMKLGVGNDRILKIFHPDAADMYDVCSNLSKVCETLSDPSIRLHELDIEIFTPFRPMLSLQCNSDELNKAFKQNKLYFVENKYDGERFQLHMENGQYKYFSKNGYDYSNVYGSNYNSGLITPHLQKIFSHISSVIFDGEMMGFNTKTNSFGSKGMNYDVKNLKPDSVHRPCYCVFDILYLNGKTITNKPLSERIHILDNLFEPIKGVIEKSPRVEVSTKEEITVELNKSVDRKEEGICFKDPHSVYKPNTRKGGWWKMKLEYFDGLMTELDVIILGGYYGDGRRSGKINSFLLGVAEDPEHIGESPKKFLTFGKVATGFSIEELDKLLNKLNEFWIPFEQENNPESVLWKKEKPDFWIDPRKSCILQIKASELTRAADFQTDYTVRFPRVEKIRYDKPWYNCLTVSELKNLTKTNKAVEKLNARHLNETDTDVSPSKRQRKYWENVSLNHLLDVEKKSNLLDGKEFCVYSGNVKNSKEDVEIQIQQFGGRVVQFAGVNTMCTLVGDITPKVKSLLKDSTRDIVKLNWIIKIIATGDASLTLTPDDMYIISSKTKIMLSNCFDKYGDSHTKCLSKKGIQRLMEKMEPINLVQLLPAEFKQIDRNISFNNPLGLFRPYFVFFDKTTSLKDNVQFSTLQQDFVFYGGTKCNEIEYHTTHIVVCRNLCNESIIERLKEKIRETRNETAKIVDVNWILNCINIKTIVLEDEFYV